MCPIIANTRIINVRNRYKRYYGRRQNGVIKVFVDGRPLNRRSDLCNSPVGFEWGYKGSGPKQLAIALLADLFKDDSKALALWKPFRDKIIARLPHAQWILHSNDIVSVN